MREFMEDEAELGSDNERHDNIVKNIDSDEDSEGSSDLDKDLEDLIDNEEET